MALEELKNNYSFVPTLRRPPARPTSVWAAKLKKVSLPDLTGLSAEALIGMMKRMMLIREFDTQSANLYRAGRLRGVTHSSWGQEAVPVGAAWNRGNEDYITSTHRGHGHVLAKGADEKLCMAELMGKLTGCCKGRGGSMHIADMSKGILGANGIVGGGMGLAIGSGLSSKVLKRNTVTICFFGDGALNQGILHEVSNMAAIWNLPVVFLCENNLYSMSGTVDMIARKEGDFLSRPAAFGIPGIECDGMDVVDVFMAVRQGVERAREGGGPTYVFCHTYRFLGHHAGETVGYRDKSEPDLWRKFEPIDRYAKLLAKQGMAMKEDLEEWMNEAKAAISAAVAFAEASPDPEPEDLMQDIFG